MQRCVGRGERPEELQNEYQVPSTVQCWIARHFGCIYMISLKAAVVSFGQLKPSVQCAEASKPRCAWLASQRNRGTPFSFFLCAGQEHTPFFSFYWRMYYASSFSIGQRGTSWKSQGQRPGRRYCQAHWERNLPRCDPEWLWCKENGTVKPWHAIFAISLCINNEGISFKMPLSSFD